MENLEIISGIVGDLKISKIYEDLIFEKKDKNIAGGTAIGAAAMGQLFTSVTLANASSGAEIDMEFFSCLVNNVFVTGKFHRVEFKENDFIEFVVERVNDGIAVHAARSPAQRMLWMSAYQSRGVAAQNRSDLKWTAITSLLGVLLIIALQFYFFPEPVHDDDYGRPAIFSFFLLMFLMTNILIRRRFKIFSVYATKVLQVLGYKNSTEVDLNILHREAQRKIKIETGKLPPLAQPWSFRY